MRSVEASEGFKMMLSDFLDNSVVRIYLPKQGTWV